MDRGSLGGVILVGSRPMAVGAIEVYLENPVWKLMAFRSAMAVIAGSYFALTGR